MKNLLMFTAVAFLSFAGTASAGETATIHVNGMVCDFCARALEKVFTNEEEVESLDISLEDKTVTVTFKEGETLSDDALSFLITDSGYDVERVER